MDAETIVTIVVLGFVVIILVLGLWALWASNTDASIKYSNGQGFDEQIVRTHTNNICETYDALTEQYGQLQNLEKLFLLFDEDLKDKLTTLNLIMISFYLWPIVTFSLTKFYPIPVEYGKFELEDGPENWPAGKLTIQQPNKWIWVMDNPPPTPDSPVVRPNFNTLYSELFCDLSQGPVLIRLPSFGYRQKDGYTSEMSDIRRFWLLECMSSWSDVYAYRGTQYYDDLARPDLLDGPLEFLITGPSWRLTHEQKEIKRGGKVGKMMSNPMLHLKSPTDDTYLLARTLVKANSPSDKEIVNALQRKQTSTTLVNDDKITILQVNHLSNPWLLPRFANFGDQTEWKPAPVAAPTSCESPPAGWCYPKLDCSQCVSNEKWSNITNCYEGGLCCDNPDAETGCSTCSDPNDPDYAAVVGCSHCDGNSPCTNTGMPDPQDSCPPGTEYQPCDDSGPVGSPTGDMDSSPTGDESQGGPSNCGPACQEELKRLCKLYPMISQCKEGFETTRMAVDVLKRLKKRKKQSKLNNLFNSKKTKEGYYTNNEWFEAVEAINGGNLVAFYSSSNNWIQNAPTQLILNLAINMMWGTGDFYGRGYNYPDPNSLLYDKLAMWCWSNFGVSPYNCTNLNAWNSDMMTKEQQSLTYPGYYDKVSQSAPTAMQALSALWECNSYNGGIVYMKQWLAGGYQGVYENFLHRQLIVWSGFGGNWIYYAAYPTYISDNRIPLCAANGTVNLGPDNTCPGLSDFQSLANIYSCNTYKMTISAELSKQLVNKQGFWGLTAYTSDGTIVKNEWDIYSISSYQNRPITYEPDESIVIYFTSAAQKYLDAGKNVCILPDIESANASEAGAYLSITFRLYYPNNVSGNLVRAGGILQEGGDLILPTLEFVETIVEGQCGGTWDTADISAICPESNDAQYVCCDCPAPVAAPSSASPEEYTMVINKFTKESDETTITGVTPQFSDNNQPLDQTVENFVVNMEYDLSVTYPAGFNKTLESIDKATGDLETMGVLFTPESLSESFGNGFVSNTYTNPGNAFVLEFSTSTPWDEPWLVPIYVADASSADDTTSPTVVGTFNGNSIPSSGTMVLSKTDPSLTFQLYMVPVDVSMGSYTLELGGLQSSIIVMVASVVTTTEAPPVPTAPSGAPASAPISALGPVLVCDPDNLQVGCDNSYYCSGGLFQSADENFAAFYVGGDAFCSESPTSCENNEPAIGLATSNPSTYPQGPYDCTSLFESIDNGGAGKTCNDSGNSGVSFSAYCPESCNICGVEPGPSPAASPTPVAAPAASPTPVAAPAAVSYKSCTTIGCDNTLYCTSGAAESGSAYYMGKFAKCSSLSDEISDNTLLVQEKNPAFDCDTIGSSYCCYDPGSGIPLYNFCPVSCDGQAEDCDAPLPPSM